MLFRSIRLPRFRKPGFAQGGMNTVMAATMRSVYSLSCAGLAILIFLYVPFQSSPTPATPTSSPPVPWTCCWAWYATFR